MAGRPQCILLAVSASHGTRLPSSFQTWSPSGVKCRHPAGPLPPRQHGAFLGMKTVFPCLIQLKVKMDTHEEERKVAYIKHRSEEAFLWFLTGGDFASQETVGSVLEAFLVSQLQGEVGASRGQRPGMCKTPYNAQEPEHKERSSSKCQ